MEKMNFGEIRKNIVDDKNLAHEHRQTEYNWRQYDSPLEAFGNTFCKTLPQEYVGVLDAQIYTSVDEYGAAFKKYIEDTLQKNKSRTAIEFGGPGSELFLGFSSGFFKKTTGVCLRDVRREEDKRDEKKIGHSVVEGDILNTSDEKMYTEIAKTLGSAKTDLIISRMMGPLKDMSKNPLVVERIVRKWYSMLNENGLLFAQFEYLPEHNPVEELRYQAEINPHFILDSEEEATEWADAIKKRFPDQIDIQLGRGVIRIHKKPGAPETLPAAKELFGPQF